MTPLWWIKICLALKHWHGPVLCKIWLIPQSVTSLLPLSHSPLNTLALEPLTGKKYSTICTNLGHSPPSIFTRYISTLFSQCKYYIAEDLRSGYLIIR